MSLKKSISLMMGAVTLAAIAGSSAIAQNAETASQAVESEDSWGWGGGGGGGGFCAWWPWACPPPPAPSHWDDGVMMEVPGYSFSAVAIDDVSGKIYAAGSTSGVADAAQVVVRFNTDGTLDTTFNSTGIVEVNLSSGSEAGRAVRLQSDGKPVLVGNAVLDLGNGNGETGTITLTRLNLDGSIDAENLANGEAGFGGASQELVALNTYVSGLLEIPGTFVVDLLAELEGADNESTYSADIDAQGRILTFTMASSFFTVTDAAGDTVLNRDRWALRTLADGSAMDPDWFTLPLNVHAQTSGRGGPEIYRSSDQQRHGFALADGTVVSSGYSNIGGRNQIVVAKFNSDGSPDTTFSSNGYVRVTPFPTGWAEAYGAAQQSDGSFVTVGYGTLYGNGEAPADYDEGLNLVAHRVDASGQFDSSFGDLGSVNYDINHMTNRGRAIAAFGDDKLIFAGIAGVPVEEGESGNNDAMLLMARPDGDLFGGFDESFHKLYDFGGNSDQFFDIRISGDDKCVAAAGSSTQRGDLVDEGATDFTFDDVYSDPNAGIVVYLCRPETGGYGGGFGQGGW